MNKGLVMEIKGKWVIVMTPEGSFERIPARNRNCQVGEEIMYAARRSGLRQPVFAAASVFVAAVVFSMMLFTGVPAAFADKSVVAYISIDINPSVEIGIDKREKVREIHGLNDKGLELVRDLKYSGRSLEEVADKLLQKVEAMKIFDSGEGDIVIASTAVKDEGIDDQLVSDQLKQQVLAHVVAKHPEQAEQIVVTSFAAPSEIREAAKQTGLSSGKYIVYLNAKNEGNDIKVEDLKQDSIHNIAKEAGGISRLIGQSKLEKENIKALLKEEKDGDLDKKVQEKKKDNEKKNSSRPGSKNSPAPTLKPSSASPSVKPTVKPGEDSRSPNVRKDDGRSAKDQRDNRDQRDNSDQRDNRDQKDSKDDNPVKNNGSSSVPSKEGKDDGRSQDDKKQHDKSSESRDEDRKTSDSSDHDKEKVSKTDKDGKEDKAAKEDKSKDRNDNKR